MVPFFVVDRPISLKIIQGLRIPRRKKIGLMAHANTSPNFRKAFRGYPRRQVIKMCDSAIFNLGGYKNGYSELFKIYEEMGTDYGVMIDVFRNARATIESAKKALAAYDPKQHRFKLVAVAQGKTVKQYLDCYKALRRMGFKYIAVGGLLQKKERTARYTNVRSEKLMRQVLRHIRKEYNPDWLFALGCLHPSRLESFEALDVWGDYKGWIFEYKKRDESLIEAIEQLSSNHLRHAPAVFRSSSTGSAFEKALAKRRRALIERNKTSDEMLSAKKSLRNFVAVVSNRAKGKNPRIVKLLKPLKSRGLLNTTERIKLGYALRDAGESKRSCDKFLALSKESRTKKTKYIKCAKKVEVSNMLLKSALYRVAQSKEATTELQRLARRVIAVLEVSERAHRVRQVRKYIEREILQVI